MGNGQPQNPGGHEALSCDHTKSAHELEQEDDPGRRMRRIHTVALCFRIRNQLSDWSVEHETLETTMHERISRGARLIDQNYNLSYTPRALKRKHLVRTKVSEARGNLTS